MKIKDIRLCLWNWTKDFLAFPPAFPDPAFEEARSPKAHTPDIETIFRKEPMIGFRAWSAIKITSLESNSSCPSWAVGPINIGNGSFWNTPVAEAFCLQNSHSGPVDQHCECGLYAVGDLEVIEEWKGHIDACQHCVVGAVIGWGLVCQHANFGWRSQYQKIIGILNRSFRDQKDTLGEEIATYFKVPFVGPESLARLLRDYSS